MDAARKEKLQRATAELLDAVRELKRTKADRGQRLLPVEDAPKKFLRAVDAFAELIAS
jgi:hypothetical protein